MEAMFDDRRERLRTLDWGHATEAGPDAGALVQEYYRRLGSWWPEGHGRLTPASEGIASLIEAELTPEERARASQESSALLDALRERKAPLERTTGELIRFILCWSLLVDRGALHLDDDPSVPLLHLFERGLQLGFSEAGVEVHHRGGWGTFRFPRPPG